MFCKQTAGSSVKERASAPVGKEHFHRTVQIQRILKTGLIGTDQKEQQPWGWTALFPEMLPYITYQFFLSAF